MTVLQSSSLPALANQRRLSFCFSSFADIAYWFLFAAKLSNIPLSCAWIKMVATFCSCAQVCMQHLGGK
jgi:hypothetical protein